MLIKKFTCCLKKDGFTLIEVLASVTLITLLLLSVFTIFTQTARSTKVAENIVDATYIGQSEMEKLYGISLDTSFENLEIALQSVGYKGITANEFEKFDEEHNVLITLEIKKNRTYSNLSTVLLHVYEQRNGPLLVQMENALFWQEDTI
nr:type II secretion system protein [Lysinibacillus timonensis]